MSIKSILAAAACAVAGFASGGDAFVVNGRLVIPSVSSADGLKVEQSADGTSGWSEVSGFTVVGGYAHGPDQTLEGVSFWRYSTDGGTSWIDLGSVNARHRLTGTVISNFSLNDAGTWFDGKCETFPDAYVSDPWAGLDLGTSRSVSGIAFLPRFVNSWPFLERMKNAEVQISDDKDFATYTVVYQQDGVNPPSELTVVTFDAPIQGRYVRLIGADYGNCAEFEVDCNPDIPVVDTLTAACADFDTGAASITWNREASRSREVWLYRSEDGGDFAKIAALAAGTTDYLDQGVRLSHAYVYALAICDESGEPGELSTVKASYVCVRRLERSAQDLTVLRAGYKVIMAGSSFVSADASKLFDGNLDTWGDMWNNDRPMIGVDFGTVGGEVHVAYCRYYPRNGLTSRAKELVVYGSDSDDWSAEGRQTQLSPVGTSSPALKWYELACDSSVGSRYVFVQCVAGWCGNLAEVEFYGWDETDLGEALFPPTDFRCTRGSTGAVLTWGGCAKAEKYVVERRLGQDGEWVQVGETTETAWTENDAALVVGQEYGYRVSAVAGSESLAAEPSSFVWYVPGDGTGLLGAYYRNYLAGEWSDQTKLARLGVDPQISFDWGGGSLVAGDETCKDNVLVVWTGELIVPRDGDYRIVATGNDFYQIWLDGNPIGGAYGYRYESDVLTLTAGRHPIRLRMAERGDTAWMTLAWSGFMGEEVIPSSQLVPAADIDVVPQPWTDWYSIGQMYYGGMVQFVENGVIRMDVGSGGLLGQTEGYTFLHQPVEGDFTAQCRYAHGSSEDYGQLAMLMVRSALANGAPFMAVAARGTTAGASFGVKQRASANADIADAVAFDESSSDPASGWLRITRRGNVFSWSVRQDGGAWKPLGDWTDAEGAFGPTVFLGPAATVTQGSYGQRYASRIDYADFTVRQNRGCVIFVR